jgi:hypothetical protein
MKITKNINLDKYKKAIDNLSSATNMANIANETIIEIQHRTQSGNNIKGNKFKKYSKEYAEYKAEHFGSSDVNLTVTNNMLHDITYKKIENGVRMYFGTSTENEKAYKNQVQMKRPFFGLSDYQRTKITKYIERTYEKAL